MKIGWMCGNDKSWAFNNNADSLIEHIPNNIHEKNNLQTDVVVFFYNQFHNKVDRKKVVFFLGSKRVLEQQ